MKSFPQKLAEVSSEWVQAGLLSAAQRAAILERHPLEGNTGGRFVAILGTIGGVLVAAGVALLISANWQDIGDWVKLGGLFALLAGAHLAGWRLRISPGRFPKTGDVFFMVGCVMFLLGIALVSQIFHLNSRPANGVLLWWIGIAALPWILRVKSAQFVSVAGLLLWLGMELQASDSWLRLHEGGRWQGGALFAAAFFFAGGALLFFGLALRSGTHADFAGIHEKLGLLIVNGALYALSFYWNRHVGYHADATVARPLPFLLFGGLALVAGAWAWRRNPVDLRAIGGWFVLGAIPALGFIIAAEGDVAWWWGLAASLMLFLLNVGMIRAGLASGRESWINLGVAFVALNILARYFDLFGSMMDGGLFFVITGLIVIGLGIYLERKRRSLVATLRKEPA